MRAALIFHAEQQIKLRRLDDRHVQYGRYDGHNLLYHEEYRSLSHGLCAQRPVRVPQRPWQPEYPICRFSNSRSNVRADFVLYHHLMGWKHIRVPQVLQTTLP